MAPRDFDELLLSAIDDALNSLGESVKQSIYFHIENKFNIKKREIPKNLKKFQTSLEKIFGQGALFIENFDYEAFALQNRSAIAIRE